MFTINLEFRKGILFIRLQGALYQSNIYKLKEVTTLLQDNGIYHIVLNLKQLEKIDNYGIDALYEIYQLVQKKEGNVLFCLEQNERLIHILSHSYLKKYMKTIRSEIDAFSVMSL